MQLTGYRAIAFETYRDILKEWNTCFQKLDEIKANMKESMDEHSHCFFSSYLERPCESGIAVEQRISVIASLRLDMTKTPEDFIKGVEDPEKWVNGVYRALKKGLQTSASTVNLRNSYALSMVKQEYEVRAWAELSEWFCCGIDMRKENLEREATS